MAEYLATCGHLPKPEQLLVFSASSWRKEEYFSKARPYDRIVYLYARDTGVKGVPADDPTSRLSITPGFQ